MSDGGAQHITFGPFFDSEGALLPSIKVYHYDAGTTNNADMWSDEGKTSAVAQPFIGDTSGIARLFGDNIYKIVIYDENDNLLYTWDNVQISRDVEGVMKNGTSYPGVATNNTWQMAIKKDGSGNFSELGVNDGSSFVSIVKMNAAGDTHIFTNVQATAITQGGNDVLDTTDLLDEDDMASNSATKGVTQQSLVAYVGSYANTGIRDISRGLVIVNNSANPNYQVDIDADEVATQDGSGGFQLLSSVNLTVDITVSGANGLDAGSEATDAWYYIWVIAKADGTTAGLLSTSSTAPTMPATYTFKALVGAVRNTSGNFVPFRQEGNRVYYTSIVQSFRLTGATLNTWTSQSVADEYPPIAKKISFVLSSQGNRMGLSPVSTGHEGHYANHGAGGADDWDGVFPDTWTNETTGSIRYASTIYYHSNNANFALYAIGWEY